MKSLSCAGYCTVYVKKNLNIAYFYNSKKIEDIQNVSKLGDYFEKFQNFCFDLDVNNMLNGSIEFKYR